MQKTVIDKICAAAIDLLQEQEFSELSVKELVAKAGVNRSSYHYHFYCLEDVIDTIIDRIENGVKAEIAGIKLTTGSNKHKYVIQYIMEGMLPYKKDILVLVDSGFGIKLQMRLLKVVKSQMLKKKVPYLDKKGQVRVLTNSVVADVIAAEATYSMMARLQYWMDNRMELSIKECMKVFRESTEMRKNITRYNDKYLPLEYLSKKE